MSIPDDGNTPYLGDCIVSDYPKLLDGSDEVFGLPVTYLQKMPYNDSKAGGNTAKQIQIMDQYCWYPYATLPDMAHGGGHQTTYAIIFNALTSPIVGVETAAVHGYQIGEPVVLDENNKPQRKPGHGGGDKTLDWIDAAAMDNYLSIVSVGSYAFMHHSTIIHGVSYVLRLNLPDYKTDLYLSLQTAPKSTTLWAHSALYDEGTGPSTDDFYHTCYQDAHKFDMNTDYTQELTRGTLSIKVKFGERPVNGVFCLFVYAEDTAAITKLATDRATEFVRIAAMPRSQQISYVRNQVQGKDLQEVDTYMLCVETAGTFGQQKTEELLIKLQELPEDKLKAYIADRNLELEYAKIAAMPKAEQIKSLRELLKGKTPAEARAFMKGVMAARAALAAAANNNT